MRIDGPLNIGLVDEPGGGRSLHVDFTDVFRALPADRRAAVFRDYLRRLETQIRALPADSRDRQGMAIILQLARELLPPIEADEIDLEETIVVEMGGAAPLAELLRTDDTLH